MKTANSATPLVETAATDEQVGAIQRLRYQIYVAEMEMDLPGVDHLLHTFTDPLDSSGIHLLARTGQKIVGAVRLNINEVPAGMEGPLELSSLPKPFVYCSRLCILPEFRGGTVVNGLIEAAFGKFEEYEAEVAVCHCYRSLMRLYLRRGFRAYGAPFVIAGLEHLGAQIPLICSLTSHSVSQAA